MSNNPPPNGFKPGDVVWVKLRTMWWPGVVCNEEHLPDGSIRPSNIRRIAIVRFFGERTFEIVKHANQILPYNCPRKYDFIFKGLVLFRKDHDYAIKFPSDVQLAEKRTGGDVNMFDRDDEFTLHPIEEKTAKALALQRKERGEPQPGEGQEVEECPHSEEHIRVQLESSKLTELLEYECTCRKPKKLKAGEKCSDCNHPPQERAEIVDSMLGNEDFELAYYNLKLTYLKNEIRAMQLQLRKDMDPTLRQKVMASIFAFEKAMERHKERHARNRAALPSTSKEPEKEPERRSISYEHLASARSPSSSSDESTSGESRWRWSRETMPSTSRGLTPSKSMEPIPSTSRGPIPSTSREPIPSTSIEPIPSTSIEPMSSTSREPMPSTSRGLIPSTSREPMPSTSRGLLPSTSREPIPSTSRGLNPSMSREPMPSTSRGLIPTTSREAISSTSREPMPSTSNAPIPSTSRQLVPLREPLPPLPTNRVREPYYVCPKTLSGISLSFLYVPLVREIPWTVPVITKKRGRKKIIKPPPPGKSRIKGESKTHIKDIYADVVARMSEENRRFEDPSIPLPLYLRPESVWPVRKVYPNWRENLDPSVNLLHPIPATEGVYKCHLCKFSCNRQNNIVIHIKLHNYGKSIEDMARRVYVNYVKRLILDENETIAVVDSDDEEEETIPPRRDPDCTFTGYTINCEDLSSNDSSESQSQSTDVIQIYRNKKPSENTNLQLIKTKAKINVEGRRPTPSPPSDSATPINRDLPSTSKAAAAVTIQSTPSTTTATNVIIQSSDSDVTSISSNESRENDPVVIMGPTKRTRMPPVPAVDIPLRRAVCLKDPITYVPPWRQPPPTHPNPLLRGAIVNPLHYLPPRPKLVIPEPKIILTRKKRLQQRPTQRQQRQRLQEPNRLEQTQRQQQPSGSKRHYDNVRKKTTSKQTDNENVREILRDWDDDDDTTTSTNNNPIPSTSRQNIDDDNDRNISDDQQQQHPIRLEDAVGMLRQLHTTDDDAELNSPARKIRNIPKKDRNRRLVTTDLTTKTRKHCDDVIEVAEDDLIRDDTPDDEIMLIDDNTIKIISNIQIVPVPEKITKPKKDKKIDRDQPSTSKITDDNSDDEDNNADVDMPTEEGNITSGDSNDGNIADQILDENICTEETIDTAETIDDQQELVKSAKYLQKSEIDNPEILKLNDVISSKVVSNVDMATTIEKHNNNNKKHNSNSIKIIENIQIFPSKTLFVKFPFNENNETGIENITSSSSSTDQKLVEEIVEKINEVNESIIEKNNIVQSEDIININELNENIENNIELPQVEDNTKNISDSLDQHLKEDTETNDKEIEMRSIENESVNQTLNTETVDQQKLIENIPDSSENILGSSENIQESSQKITNLSENIVESSKLSENIPDSSENILELSENLPELSEEKLSVNIPETSENILVESTENLTDNLPTTTRIKTKNYEEKSNESNENSPIYRESLLDIAIRDLITPFEPEKKLPSSKKASKRGETQSIRKSSRKSDNIYKILGREITTPSPSPGNMATTNEIVVNQQANPTTSSSIDDSSNSATEITIKSTGRGRRRSKKNLNQNVANELEQIVVVEQSIDDDANLKNKNESIIENVIEHLSVEDEKETKNDIEDIEKEEISSIIVVPNKTVGKTLKNEILIEQLSEEQPIIENVKSGRKARRVKHQDDERKSTEREEIPKIIIKSPPKNSNENPKIITKRSSSPGDKPLQENSPKKLKKLQLKSPVVVVNKSSFNLISSTTNEIPSTTSSSTSVKSPPEEIVEAKQQEIQKSAISCFDFNEDDSEIILTPLNKLKKKYMSPPADKYKDEKDNNKMKETERKDQLLTAEIENILNNTKIPELKKIEITAAPDKSVTITKPSTSTFDATSPISTTIDSITQDVKGLPIKERGKRFFKSRNRPKTDENIITNVGGVPIDTTLKEIKSTNLNQGKKNSDIIDSGDFDIEKMSTQNKDSISVAITGETSIEIKNISQETENTIIKATTVQENIETCGGLISNIASENELFIAETLLSFPNTVTTETTTSTLKNLENINVKLQNLKDDQQQQQIETNQITENLIEQLPIQEKRTQIRVKSLEKLNQQFEDSLLQEKDIGKPTIDIVKPLLLPLEHITRRRRSHLKITPRKRVLQQPVKLETTSNVVVEPNEAINIVKIDESQKSDETTNYAPGEIKIDENTVPTVVASESMIISETNIADNKKINEETNLDTVQVVDETSTTDKDNLTITKTEDSKTVTQQYEENFVEKYMKDSKLFDPSKEKTENELNKNKNVQIIESPLEILNTDISEPSQQLVVSSTENKNNQKSEIDNERNASSSSLSMKLTPSTQSISDIRSFRPRRKTSNKRSPSFSSEYPSSRRASTEYQVDTESKIENVDRNVIDEPTTTRITTSSIQIPNSTITTIVSSTNKLDIINVTDKSTTLISNINVKFDTINPLTDKLDPMNPLTDKLDSMMSASDKLDTIKSATDKVDTLKPTTDKIDTIEPLTDIFDTTKPSTDKLDVIKAPTDNLDIINPTTEYIDSIQPSTDNIDLVQPPTDKLIIDTNEEQQIQHHQLSPTIEKIQINVDLSNPLTTQIAKIFAAQNPLTKQPITITDDITTLTTPTILSKLGEEARSSSSAGTIKRKNTIEEEIPMFLIEKTIKCVTEQEDTANKSIQPPPEKIKKTTGIIKSSTMKLSSSATTGKNEQSEVTLSPINKTSSSQFSSTNKNTLGSGKLIITQLRDTSSSPGNKSADIKPDQSDMSNIFDFTNMPIYIANESNLPFVVTTTASTTISPTVNSLSMNTTASTTPTTIVKRQGRGRPRKVLQTTTIISTTPITTLSTSIPKYTSTSQQTFNKPVSKNLSSYVQHQQQPVQQINSNTNNNYPIVHQTHTQQILDSQNYNLLQSANNSSTSVGKEVGIDSKGNRFILIKQGNSQKMVKQSASNLPSSSSTDINKTKFTNYQTTTKPLQQSDLANINVISSEVILPPTKPIKNQTTNLLITKRAHQPDEELHQPEKKINLMGQQSGQFVITSKGDVIQSQNIKPITQACTTSQTLTSGKPVARRRELQNFKNDSLGQQTHITGDSQQIIQQQQQQPSTTTNINHQQMFMESNINIQQQQPPPLTKGKITTTSQRGKKRKNENVMTCYNESQLEMPPLTAIQQNSPTASTDLKKLPQQHNQEQDTKKLKLLEKEQEIANIKKQLENEQLQISTTHSIDENVTNQLVSDIDNLPSTSIQQCEDELQTNKIMAVPANHFGIPGNAYYLCSQSPDGDYLPIDSQKLYLDPDVNQLVPLTCLSKNTLATVLASEEAAEVAAAAQAQQQTAIILQTDDTDALIEETTEQSDIEEESKHNMEIQLIAAQQVAVVAAEQQQQQIIDSETTVLFDQTSNRQYIVEGGGGRGGAVVEQITDNIVGATVGATVTASTDSIVDNIICLDIDENQQQIISIDESDVISDISSGGGGVNNVGISAPVTTSAITPVAAENLLTAEDVSGFLASDQSIVINVDGQQLILDQQSFLALAATDGESAQLETAEGQTYILSREFLAALGIGGGGGVSSSNTGNIVNDDAQILLHDNNHDIIAAALAGTEVYYQQQEDDLMNLQIETSNGIVQQLVGEETLTFQHLTPPVTAETNETSALLTQPPIMSALEVPSNKKLNKSNKMYSNNKNELIPDDDDNNTNNRLLTRSIPPQNLDDCIAFIGVSTQSSTIPSSLELPITITNPAIAPPKNSTNPIDTIYNTKGLGIPTTIGNLVGSSSSSQISPHLITCNGEQELQYELFTTTQTTSQLKSTSNNLQNDDIFQTNFDDPTR